MNQYKKPRDVIIINLVAEGKVTIGRLELGDDNLLLEICCTHKRQTTISHNTKCEKLEFEKGSKDQSEND